jgi:tetratricopeptide (TPR) repeat protein
MGKILSSQKDFDGALNAYGQALFVQPNSVEAQAAVGEILLAQRRFMPAISAYHQLIKLSPRDANAYYNLGIALQGVKQNKEAAVALIHARDLYKLQGQKQELQRAEAALRKLTAQ